MGADLFTFLTDLVECESREAAWTRTTGFLRGLGIEWVHYAYGRSDLSTLPQSWREHYAARGFYKVNRGAHHCYDNTAPILVGPDFTPDDACPLEREWMADAKALGIRSEVVVPIRSRPAGLLGGLSASMRLRRTDAENWFEAYGSLLRVAVYSADTRLVQLARQEEAAAVRLSPREREVLLWLAKGLRNDRIAERMGIKNPTVELHLAQARRKLGAATREQALGKAIVLGLIVP